MSAQPTDPVSSSVHSRLLNQAAAAKEDFNSVLTRYGNERLLYRLTKTNHGRRFTLKGASLFILWLGRMHRPTRDLDLLGTGRIDTDFLQTVFSDVCKVEVEPDGVRFDAGSITVAEIREGQEYGGLRVRLDGLMGSARLRLQIDVGMGDVVIPSPQEATFPTLLEMPAPRIKVYPREAVIAEKLDATIDLGMKNSRMKDYYDIALLARCFAFDCKGLSDAFEATLARRNRQIPMGIPVGLSDDFAANREKARQWVAFTLNRRAIEVPGDLLAVVRQNRAFIQLPLNALKNENLRTLKWPPGGPWS